MATRIFLAGASGAIGKRLVPLLSQAGYRVTGMTRDAAKADLLGNLGARPFIADVYDVASLTTQLRAFAPAIVIHQLTALPPGLEPSRMEQAVVANARIRDEGTRNLVAAAVAGGASRFIAQSIAWAYAEGPTPHHEDDPLDPTAEGSRGISMRGVASLERQVLQTSGISGTVLRYGHLYGPGTGFDTAHNFAPLHVDDAAHAALLAVQRDALGVFNVAEPNDYVSSEKAERVLGWRPGFRLSG